MQCPLRMSTAAIILLLGPMVRVGHAEDGDSESDPAQRFSQLAESEAKSYRFAIAGKTDGFQLQPDSVLNWTNPVSGSIRGKVFIWTHEGRPCAIASIYKYDEKTLLSTEFHSLMTEQFRAIRDDGITWSPSDSGVNVRPFVNANPPSTTRAARRLEMRSFARRFSAERIDPDESKWSLRLMPQPLFRYEAPVPGVIDGAVFALAQGTNPDVILLIEAFQDGRAA